MAGSSLEVETRRVQGEDDPSKVAIRPMTLADLDAVVAIECASFSQPWTPDMFRAELTENSFSRFFAAVAGAEILGYIGGWVVKDELQVVSLAVRPDARRRRTATRLLAHLFDHAGGPVRRAFLEVRHSNREARTMYERFGFRPVGVRRGYYDEPKEDAVLMERVM